MSVHSVAGSSGGRPLCSAGSDEKAKVWDSRTAEPLNILSGHPDRVGCIALSPDGELLASGGYGCKIKVWSKEGTEGIDAASGLDGERPTRGPLYEPKVAQIG